MSLYFTRNSCLKHWRELREEFDRAECLKYLGEFCDYRAEEFDIDPARVYQWISEWESRHGGIEGYAPKKSKRSQPQPNKITYSPVSLPVTSVVTGSVTEEKLLYTSDNLITEISNFPANLMIATRPGAGKSTLTNAIIHEILNRQDNSEIHIVDPKTNKWLGLEKSPQVVTYLSGSDDDMIGALQAQIEKAHNLLADRIQQKQQGNRQGKRSPNFHHYYLLIDEWYAVFNVLLGGNEKHPAVLKLKDLVVKGRELHIHCILVTQSHLCTECGFSKALRDAFDFVCLGSASSSFEPLYKFASDNNMVSNQSQRVTLNQAVEQGIKKCGKNRLAVVTLGGVPRVTIIPDLRWLERVTVEVPDELLQPTSTAKTPVSAHGSREAGNNGNDEGTRTLYRLVTLLTEYGCNDTTIIERGLGCRGRSFNDGKEALRVIRELGQRHGW